MFKKKEKKEKEVEEKKEVKVEEKPAFDPSLPERKQRHLYG
jgi:hypothetical protein